MKLIKAHLNNSTYNRFKTACDDQNVTMRQVLKSAILIYLNMYERQKYLEEQKELEGLKEEENPCIMQ
tara:strand:+ start:1014 stop:1217 length:204 start_codon:yes stop_codon:yes gene_type:complete